jgi:TolB-like protein
MERIPMDLLILLVRENGRLVSRDEIIERLWGKDIFFDTDNSINTAIRKIRRALGEDPEKPRYIETVQGKGYRFKSSTDAATGIASPHQGNRKASHHAGGAAFENLSGDPGQEYFSDGLTEETIMRFGKMSPQRLGVIARTSSMAYKRTDKSVFQIGQELGVDYVLEGSVRREAERIRVTAQLIRVRDQIHLWAENFDRPSQSILDIHGEVGAAIAAHVQLELTPEGERQLRSQRPVNREAYDHYLHGRYHWARLTPPELVKAAEYFRKATQCDPEYALAYSGLADTLSAAITSEIPAKDAFPEAKAAIARALALDPDSAEAHNADATIKFLV